MIQLFPAAKITKICDKRHLKRHQAGLNLTKPVNWVLMRRNILKIYSVLGIMQSCIELFDIVSFLIYTCLVQIHCMKQ